MQLFGNLLHQAIGKVAVRIHAGLERLLRQEHQRRIDQRLGMEGIVLPQGHACLTDTFPRGGDGDYFLGPMRRIEGQLDLARHDDINALTTLALLEQCLAALQADQSRRGDKTAKRIGIKRRIRLDAAEKFRQVKLLLAVHSMLPPIPIANRADISAQINRRNLMSIKIILMASSHYH